MGEYIDAIWGWDEQVQRDHHARGLATGRWQIITADGTDVGMLNVEYRQSEIYLARVEIQPDHQGQGIDRHGTNNIKVRMAAGPWAATRDLQHG